MGGAARRLLSGLEEFEQVLLPPARFQPSALEREFLDDYAHKYASRRRLSIAFGLVLWTSFIGFDIWVGGPTMAQSVMLRALGSLILAGFLALSFNPAFRRERFAEPFVVACAITAYLPLLALVATVDPASNPLVDAVGVMAYLAVVSNLTFLRARGMLLLLTVELVTVAPALAFDIYATHEYPRRVGLADLGALIRSAGDNNYVLTLSYIVLLVLVGYATASQRERAARLAFERERSLASANLAQAQSRRELEERTAALVAAKEDLRVLAERRNREKSKFLADAAHDLSQPTHAVSLLIEATRHALARGDLVQSATLLATAAHAAQVTRASFSAVLEISQLETGSVRAAYATVGVEDLIDDVVAPLRVIAQARGVRLAVRRSGAGPVSIRTDRALFGRALANVISNAIKYSDPAKADRRSVLIGVVALGDRARIDVIDNGVGIPAAKLEEVFQPFVQLDNPTRDRERGLGLGLSIVRAAIDLLEGHRMVLRSREGRGARVSLSAPRERPRQPAAAREDRLTSGGPDFASLFVWCVEDDPLAREAMVALLDELGMLTQVSPAFDDLERTLEWTDRRPDLVISDYRLPGGHTAHDVARAFARRWSDIPLLVVTGEVAPEEIMGPPGRTRLLRKPVSPESFVEAIEHLCGARAAPAAPGRAATPPR
ncbi:MAG TPA: hybrid sensor histidine kinase/response regulator [Phenylobacterium sp.]|nr:hybrid sensor histidine kinase/response regulator [Phenylobacterium sp.]